MSSHRPYRPTLSMGAVIKELEDNKGKLYAPQIVAICIKLFKNKKFSFKNNNSPDFPIEFINLN
jgi:HD-GYP domain-containing protein (c-di-GMP phosphodiesterase class II)